MAQKEVVSDLFKILIRSLEKRDSENLVRTLIQDYNGIDNESTLYFSIISLYH